MYAGRDRVGFAGAAGSRALLERRPIIAERRSQTQLPRLPLKASIDLTYRCDNHCRHCWLWLAEEAAEQRDELSTDEWREVVAAASSASAGRARPSAELVPVQGVPRRRRQPGRDDYVGGADPRPERVRLPAQHPPGDGEKAEDAELLAEIGVRGDVRVPATVS